MATRQRTRLDVDARRTQLLDIGMELFSGRPYDEVGIEEIAQRAGVSRGLLYHYFPTKRDFWVAGVRRAVDQVYGLTEPDQTLSPLERLRASVDVYLEFAEKHAHGVLTTHRAAMSSDPEVRAIIEQGQALQIARIVQDMIGDTEAPPVLYLALRGWLAVLVIGAVDWLERRTVERTVLRELLVNAFVGLVFAARQADPELDQILPTLP